jgi:hypothetical protein
MQMLVIYHPLLQGAFKTAALIPWQWGLILAVSLGPAVVYGIIMLVRNQRARKLIRMRGQAAEHSMVG